MSEAITMETRTYTLTGISPLLGSNPASEAIRTQYIASKAPKPVDDEDNLTPDIEEKGLTVFLRDPDNRDRLMLMDYTIKGYFKGALSALKAQLGVGAERGKVDRFVAIQPRRVPIIRDGEPIYDEDDQLERVLRAQTMQGERTTLAASEMINPPWSITISVTLIPNKETKASKALTWEAIETCLDYGGRFAGIGQWRSGGYGLFTWHRVVDDGSDNKMPAPKKGKGK